jgi:hypothetical protein
VPEVCFEVRVLEGWKRINILFYRLWWTTSPTVAEIRETGKTGSIAPCIPMTCLPNVPRTDAHSLYGAMANAMVMVPRKVFCHKLPVAGYLPLVNAANYLRPSLLPVITVQQSI